MKKLLFIATLFFCLTANAQQDEKMHGILPVKNEKICYSEVVEVPGVSKDELYNRAYTWFVKTYKSAKDVIQMADKESGKIIGKGWFTHPFSKIKTEHSVTIMVKDGRYKYIITDFIFNDKMVIAGLLTTFNDPLEETYKNMKPERKIHAKNMNQFNDYVNAMVQTLKDSMNKTASTGETEEDNW